MLIFKEFFVLFSLYGSVLVDQNLVLDKHLILVYYNLVFLSTAQVFLNLYMNKNYFQELFFCLKL